MSMEWSKLLCDRRYGGDDTHRNTHRTEFEEDFDNIIFSTGFRRLQGKAQVFSLSGSDYVRTRLTHSCEVATNGRALGTMVENLTCAPGKPMRKNTPRPSNCGTLVAAACLAHDIGNPP